ncbi:ParB/RepB/Spo0J family partition protein [Nonomuraea turcica]|uniref:ParB/RepB/Spo0J family partition protein n=1 Tax=Nonomuraea sp. G32 TaxID=3067274 RepID=UPI00273BF098|nr:hypothetical protein [Nonomuraea sp. G32]MDP4510296.1 hypothetical protein [Nonomuraea sp. G32]
MSITSAVNDPATTPEPAPGAVGTAPAASIKHEPDVEREPGVGLEPPENFRLANIPVRHLGHFPDNVREDYHLTQSFCASLKSEQQVPVTVIPIPADYQRGEGEEEHLWWVVKGNRRLAGSLMINLPTLLCLIDLTKAEDRASLLVDQVVENDDEFRRGLTPFEQSRALFLAHQLGATRTEIRKKTGRTREEVAQAITAGKLSEPTRRSARAMEYTWTLDELALLEEFDGDAEALTQIDSLISRWGHSGRHAIERVRRDRQEAAAHAQALADLEAAGIPVTEDEPPGAVRLSRLASRVEGFDPEQHTDCPGRGAFFYSWRQEQAELYCSTPERHGYAPPPTITLPATKAKDDGPSRKIVVQGNRAWMAAATVRQEWLAGFLARKSAPKPVQRFVTRILNAMPQALRDELGRVKHTTLYTKLGGPADLDAALASASPGRLAMLQLLPIAAAFEHQMSEASAECKNTWREGRYSPCSTSDAALWLRFVVQELGPELADKAYDPAPIERALIEGTAYRGDTPEEDSISPDPQEEAEPPADPAGDEPDEREALAEDAEAEDAGEGGGDDAGSIADVLDESAHDTFLGRDPSEPGVEVPAYFGAAEESATDPMAA